MVAAQVREHGDGEVDGLASAELERVRGDLHRARAVASRQHRVKVGLEIDRLGGGARDRALVPADDRGDRTQQSALDALRLQQRAHEVGRGRLSVRARDPHDAQLRAGVAVEARGHRSHRVAAAGHEHFGHRQPDRALDDQRGGAALDGLCGELVAVALKTAHAEEQVSGADHATVVGEPLDRHVGACHGFVARVGAGQAGGQLVEPHGLIMLPRGDAKVWQRERHDLAERGRRHGAAVDRPGLGFIDDHRAQHLLAGSILLAVPVLPASW